MKKPRRLTMDLLLIALLLAAALVLYVVFGRADTGGAWAVVSVDGQEVARYSLDRDGVYTLNGGTNVLVIQDGAGWMQEAHCPDQLCMAMKISKAGGFIACLPNRLVVTVEGGEQQLDGVVG